MTIDYSQFLPDNGSDSDNIDYEALRRRIINKMEAAYFGGIGPAVVGIAEVRNASKDRLVQLARQWGVRIS